MQWPTWPNLPWHKGSLKYLPTAQLHHTGRFQAGQGVEVIQTTSNPQPQHFHQVNSAAGVRGNQAEKSLGAICHRNLNDLFNNTVKKHTLASVAHQPSSPDLCTALAAP